jgi:glyoxylase I family protein
LICSLRHFGLVVRDLERALNFYCDVLGLRVVRRMEEAGPFLDTILAMPDVRVTTVKLGAKEGPTLLELLHFERPDISVSQRPSLFSTGATHFAITVTDLASVYRNLLNAEASVLAAPERSPDGRAFVCFGRDPEGNLIEFVEELNP